MPKQYNKLPLTKFKIVSSIKPDAHKQPQQLQTISSGRYYTKQQPKQSQQGSSEKPYTKQQPKQSQQGSRVRQFIFFILIALIIYLLIRIIGG